MRLASDKPLFIRKKQVGIIKIDRTYVTYRDKTHFFMKYQGFGLSANILSELRKYEVGIVKLIYSRVDGTQEVWMAKTDDFYLHGIIYKDLDNDYQRILNKRYWEIR